MNLHRAWGWWLQLAIVILGPVALALLLAMLVQAARAGWSAAVIAPNIRGWVGWGGGVVCYVLIAWKTLTQLRFRFVIDACGLRMRTSRVDAALRWEEIDSIILDDIRLLIVPAAGYRANPYPGLTQLGSTTHDGRPCKEVLGLTEVWESRDRIAAALSKHAGPRFTDAAECRG